MRRPTSFLPHVYSLLFVPAAVALRLAGRFSPRLHQQLQARPSAASAATAIAIERARWRDAAVFFCSSAGEFEQAKPLIDRLAASGQVFVQVVFFSQSGLQFAQARGEAVACCLSPLTDSIWEWGWLFAALRPTVTCVVRHELWPGFLEVARRYGRLYLIDASCSLGERQSRLKRWLRGQLFRWFDGICTVTAADRQFFIDTYGVSPERLTVTGDTKYDRVRERAAAKAPEVARLKQLFDLHAAPGAARLVVGSAYRDEVQLLLAAHAQRGPAAAPWQIIVAPHHLDEELLQWIEQQCAAHGLRAQRYSQLAAAARPSAVIILDTMGMLSEVYGTATAAFIGGALHRQVHNVLEPASHGLALAYGPLHKNSAEAEQLVAAGLAAVVADVAALSRWWQSLDQQGALLAGRMRTAVADMGGASEQILRLWRHQLGSDFAKAACSTST